jgi:hypothetical protein
MKRIPVFDVALCYRQKKYQPGGFPASFAFTLSFSISQTDTLSMRVRSKIFSWAGLPRPLIPRLILSQQDIN